MRKEFWTVFAAVACVFWGTTLLFNQHHLSAIIPTLAGWLLTTGIGLIVVFFWFGRKS